MFILICKKVEYWDSKAKARSLLFLLAWCCLLSGVGAAAQQASQLSLLSERAKEALNKGRYKEAQEAYQEIVKQDSQSPEAYSNLGLALYMQRKYSGAISPLRTALHISPNLQKTAILLALSYFHVNEFRKAIPLLGKAYVREKNDPTVVQYLGLAYLEIHEDGKALAMLSRWADLEPNSPDALYYKGKAASYVSLDAFEKLKEVAPHSSRMYELQAELFAQQGRTDAAISEYEKALAKWPELPGLHLALGKLYWENDNLTKARTELEKELQVSPYDASTQYLLGDVLLHQNNLTDAAIHLTRALEVQPDLVDARLDMAKLYQLEGKTKEAIKALQSVIVLDGNRPEPHYLLYQLYKKLKDPDKASAELATFQKLKSSATQEVQDSMRSQEFH